MTVVIILLSVLTYISSIPEFRINHMPINLLSSSGMEIWRSTEQESYTPLDDTLPLKLTLPSHGKTLIRSDYPLINTSVTYLSLNIRIANKFLVDKAQDISKRSYMYLMFFDGTAWGDVTSVVTLPRTKLNHLVKRVIKVPEGAVNVRVQLSFKTESEWVVEEVTLYADQQTKSYNVAAITLLVLWISVAVVCSRALFARVNFAAGIYIVGFFVLSTALILVPKSNVLLFMAQLLKLLNENISRSALFMILDFGHFLIFFIFSVLLMMSRIRLGIRTVEIIMMCMALALASESIQMHLSSRSGQFADVLFDLVGAIAGIIMYRAVFRGK